MAMHEERRRIVHESIMVLQKAIEKAKFSLTMHVFGEDPAVDKVYDDDYEAVNKALLFMDIAYDELENVV